MEPCMLCMLQCWWEHSLLLYISGSVTITSRARMCIAHMIRPKQSNMWDSFSQS